MSPVAKTKTARASKLNLSLRIRSKLILLFLLFGLVPALGLFGLFLSRERALKDTFSAEIAANASRAMKAIDANMFERYGDVQAFALNTATVDPANWDRPSPDNPLVRAMNGYMTGYGLYRLMMLVSPDGKVLDQYLDPETGHGLHQEAVEVARRVGAGELESSLLPHAETIAVMEVLDEVRRQVGVTYPGE